MNRNLVSGFIKPAITATAALALIGIGTTAAQASTVTLDDGHLSITQAKAAIGDTIATPAVGDGSWVRLNEDGNNASYYNNAPSSRTASGEYTAIDSTLTGLALGSTQNGGSFSTNTQFYGPFGAYQFDGWISDGTLKFDTTSVAGTSFAPLVQNDAASDLTGFQIEYPAGSSNFYDVGGSSSTTPSAPYLTALTGGYKTTGDAYWVEWKTDIVSADAFDGYEAKFHLEGTYTPNS